MYFGPLLLQVLWLCNVLQFAMDSQIFFADFSSTPLGVHHLREQRKHL